MHGRVSSPLGSSHSPLEDYSLESCWSKKKALWPWPGGLVCCSIHQKVMGSISSQSTYRGCRFDPWSGCIQEATNQYFSPSMSLPLSKGISKYIYPQVRIKEKKNEALWTNLNPTHFLESSLAQSRPAKPQPTHKPMRKKNKCLCFAIEFGVAALLQQ